MADSDKTLQDIYTQLLETATTVNELKDICNNLNLGYITNFNYVVDNVSNLNDKISTFNTNVGALSVTMDKSNISYVASKLENYNNLISNIIDSYNVKVFPSDISNFIYCDIYDSNNILIVSKYKLTSLNSINDLFFFVLPLSDNNLTGKKYYLKIYYLNDNNTINVPVTDIHQYKASKDGKIERYRINIETSKLNSVNNYKFICNKNSYTAYSSPIFGYTIESEKFLDIRCFSISNAKKLSDLSNYTFTLKEELFDSIIVELNIADYTLDDIGDVLYGNAERDLTNGEFTVYDKLGNMVVKMASYRLAGKERRILLDKRS